MLSQTATYAIRSMAFLAAHRDDGPILSQTIAREMEIPGNFLSKILNRLVQAGFIHSIRGTKGGFVLAKKPSEIRVRDIADLFMRFDDFKKCFLGLHDCDGTCRLHRHWLKIVNQMERLLDETTIDRIL